MVKFFGFLTVLAVILCFLWGWILGSFIWDAASTVKKEGLKSVLEQIWEGEAKE